jgi:hypothetical protein
MYRELSELRAELERELLAGGARVAIVERAVRAGFRFARAHQTQMRLLLRAVMSAGELDPKRRKQEQLPFLARASELLGAALGRPAAELRLPVQSIVALVARYAVSSERELEGIVSGDTPGGDPAAAVESHLVAVALAILGIREPRTRHGHA